jgi:hypothetical protein
VKTRDGIDVGWDHCPVRRDGPATVGKMIPSNGLIVTFSNFQPWNLIAIRDKPPAVFQS